MGNRKIMTGVSDRYKDLLGNMDWVMVCFVILITAMLATLSVLRYVSYNARMFDLGHMTQAIWSGTQGRPLEFSYHGYTVSRLSLHVELVYFLLIPLYAIFPSPITLLLVQSLLFGLSAIPLYRLAKRRILNLHAARVVTLIYLLYPSAHRALLFDFHGDTLAMPLLVFAFEALDREAWFAYGGWLLLALSCKFHVAFSVCALGIFLCLHGRSRVGGSTLLAGAIWGAIMFLIVRPSFALPSSTAEQLNLLGYVTFYYGGLFEALINTGVARFFVAVVVFIPILSLAFYAIDWMVLTFVVAIPVLLSSGPGPSYSFIYHHYATVVPFISMVVIHSTARLRASGRSFRAFLSNKSRLRLWPLLLGVTMSITLLLNMRFVSTPLRPRSWSEGFEEGVLWEYKRTSRDVVKDRWLTRYVPEEVPLLVSAFLGPHLANRHNLHIARPLDGTEGPDLGYLLDRVDYAVLDGLFDHVGYWLGGDVTYDWEIISEILQREDYGLISGRDGLLLFQRRVDSIPDNVWAEMTLTQSVTVEPVNSSPTTLATFGDVVDLIDGSVTSLGERRYRFQYIWSAHQNISTDEHLFAVTYIVGIEDARILHIPTAIMQPVTTWSLDETITETFEIELPADIDSGRYEVKVGWYDSNHRSAYATDERSCVGDVVSVTSLEIVNP